jgi:hypothetical protein
VTLKIEKLVQEALMDAESYDFRGALQVMTPQELAIDLYDTQRCFVDNDVAYQDLLIYLSFTTWWRCAT